MTADTIPQDIRAKAAAAHAQFADSRVKMNLGEIIALALLSHERETIERCAQIAEEYALSISGDDYGKGGYERALEIATAIRETAR